MILKSVHSILKSIHDMISNKFMSITLNFLFIMIFTTVFQNIFGPENSIVSIVLVIIMCSAMLRDLTSTPIKQFFIHLFILESMCIVAYLVNTLPLPLAWIFNFILLFVLLYAFTFEYATSLYMPYLISYLFLLFISPISLSQLPTRIVAMFIGAICVIMYQLVMGRNKRKEIPQQALTALVNEAQECVRCLLLEEGIPDNPQMVHNNLCKLSRLIFERRKRTLCISDASSAMLESGRNLERLILLLYDMEGPITPERMLMVKQIDESLSSYKEFLTIHPDPSILLDPNDSVWDKDPIGEPLLYCLVSIRKHLQHMMDLDKRRDYHKTALSIWIRVKAAINLSSIRVVYSLRIATLLSFATLLVQYYQLPHGKWLLFTLASVSLPQSNDVLGKAQKRLFATLVGGTSFFLAFSLLPNIGIRTIFMMFMGYLTGYFADYKFSFACSTVGALGGAAISSAFGFNEVGSLFLIRVAYILLGIVIAYFVNCIIYPYTRKKAIRSLWKKLLATVDTLCETCENKNMDRQLYSSLLIQSYLQEEKLFEMTKFENRKDNSVFFLNYRKKIRDANLQNI